MSFDDFQGKDVPEMIERVKVDLRRQRVQFFQYGTEEYPAEGLLGKGRFGGRHSKHVHSPGSESLPILTIGSRDRQ